MNIRVENEKIKDVTYSVGDLITFEEYPNRLYFICKEPKGYILRCFYGNMFYVYNGFSDSLYDCINSATQDSGKIIGYYPSSEYELVLTKKQ